MPGGVLKLRLVDVYGKSIKDRVTLTLEHRVLNHRITVKDISVSGTIKVEGLHPAPQGIYTLDIIPRSYRRAREFVDVGRGTLRTVVLQIHPMKAKPILPSYTTLETANQPLIGVLERSGNVAGCGHKTGAELWGALTSLQKAALLNIAAKAFVAPIRRGEGILPHVTLREVHQDRCFVDVPKALVEKVDDASGGLKKPFRKVSGKLHDPPSSSFTFVDSYKTRDKFGNLQFTFFHAPATGEYAADIDVDDASGIRHVVDVAEHSVKKVKTHPYDIHEILVEHQQLDVGYTLAPK